MSHSCLLLAVLGLAGCASGLRTTARSPSAPLELTTVFVYPTRLLGMSEPAWRQFELSERMLRSCVRVAGERLAFFGPTEFRVMQLENDHAWVASTALPLLAAQGQRPDQGAVLRTTIERRVMSAVQEAQNAKGQGGATSSELTTFIARAELIHPSTAQVLYEVETEATVDPFAEPPPEAEYDPAPAMTALLDRVAAEAAGHAAKHSIPRVISADPGLSTAVTPKSAFSLRIDSASTAEAFKLDPLAAEVLLENIARVLSPWLTGRALATVVTSVPGVAVVGAPPGSRLQPGDVIESVDGAPALPHVLARGRFKGAPMELEVRHRDGSSGNVVFP